MRWMIRVFVFAAMVAGSAAGADNLALKARASASESQDNFTPDKAIDGKPETRWSGIPGHNTGVWYQLDWEKPVRIGEVIIHQFDRFTWELDVQAWDAARGDWRTIRHFGQPSQRLPLVVLCRTDPVETIRLRIGNITHGPSFNEVEVYAEPFSSYAPVVRLGSDLHGGFWGVATDPWGSAGIPEAEVALSGEGGAGKWQETIKCDAQGVFRAAMPVGMKGRVQARLAAGARTWASEFDAPAFQYGLTPVSINERPPDLNGKWRFAIDPPDEFWRPDFDDGKWKTISVPAHWRMEGFTGESGVGGYRTRFESPGTGRVKLRFDGVYSGAEVWVNGVYVASHEGGATPFEADVTDAVRPSGNVLAIRVTERTQTSEKLDKMSLYADFGLGGIMRKVILLRVPSAHIGALALSSRFDAEYRNATLAGRITVVNESAQALRGQLALRLTQADGKPIASDVAAEVNMAPWTRTDVAVSLPVRGVRGWTAEDPNLYLLAIELRAGEQAVQRLVQRVGFRQTEIRGTEILINGRPVKFRGTCHHDSHPLMGRAVTEALERQDLELMKQANLNAVRTSHYPPLPELLDIADELGLYVEDEAPFCWVSEADNLTLWPRILQLTAELVARDRNHPSVFMWSLCNESEFGAGFRQSHAWVKQEDPSRPTAAATSASLDIATLHNPLAISRIEKNEKLDKPLLFDESLAPFQGIFRDVAEMWVDPGLRDYYAQPLPGIYDRFMASRVTQGSMIWCWADDIFCLPNRGLEYGRGATRCHFIENCYRIPGRGLTGDAPWGLVDGWRRAKPEFWIARKLHSPVKIREGPIPFPAAGEPLRVAVQNQYDFTDLSELAITWQIGQEKGRIKASVPPRSSGQLEIRPAQSHKSGEVLVLEFADARGRQVDSYQLPLEQADVRMPALREPGGAALRILREETLAGPAIRVVGKDFEMAFDQDSGRLRRGVAFGQALLLDWPALHLLPTATPMSPLPNHLTWRLRRLEVKPDAENVRVLIQGGYENFDGEYDLLITPAGHATAHAAFKYGGADMLVREIGLALAFPGDCDLLRWRRRAEWSVYPADHIGRPSGECRAFARHPQTLPPTWPWARDNSPMGCNDFRSTKRNIDWVSMAYPDGPGAWLESDGSQHARAIVESDRVVLHVNGWFGGTHVGWWEWTHNYGEGRKIAKGEMIEQTVQMRLGQATQGTLQDSNLQPAVP